MAREKAVCRANEELKYRCTRCTNHMFRQRGRCSFQWHSGKFVDRCRYYHNESERRAPPMEDEIERRVFVLMWG